MAIAHATGVGGRDLKFQLSPDESVTLLNVAAPELLPAHPGFFDEP